MEEEVPPMLSLLSLFFLFLTSENEPTSILQYLGFSENVMKFRANYLKILTSKQFSRYKKTGMNVLSVSKIIIIQKGKKLSTLKHRFVHW